MEDTHTTVVVEKDKWIEIVTLHDQSGSAAIGLVPIENIPLLIEVLKKFILPVSRWFFFYEGEEDGWTFQVEAKDHIEAFDKAYEMWGPQVKSMFCRELIQWKLTYRGFA